MDKLRNKLSEATAEKRTRRYAVSQPSKLDTYKEPSDEELMAYKISGGVMTTYLQLLDSSLYDLLIYQLIIKKQEQSEDE